MMFLLIVEAMLAFIVVCADSVGEERPRPPLQRVARALLWPATVWVWFTHRSVPKLARLGAIVWLLLTGGWLIALLYDVLPNVGTFLLATEATLAFVVYCVDAMSAEFRHKHVRRALRSVFWPKPLVDFLRDSDSIKLVQASVTVWILLTSGWLLALLGDRLARPLGWL
jgi:hypothetical protein